MIRRLYDWLRPRVTVTVSVRFALPRVGIVSEAYSLASATDKEAWDVNCKTYAQLGIIEHKARVWRWRVAALKAKQAQASATASRRPNNLTLRKATP